MKRPSLALALAGVSFVAACGGNDGGGAADTTAAVPSAPQAQTQTPPAPPASTIARRLEEAGYHVVAAEAPGEPRGATEILTTGVGSMIVYVVSFDDAAEADAYADRVAAIARRSPDNIVARRVGLRLYSAVAAERPDAVAGVRPLLDVIRIAEAKPIAGAQISPR